MGQEVGAQGAPKQQLIQEHGERLSGQRADRHHRAVPWCLEREGGWGGPGRGAGWPWVGWSIEEDEEEARKNTASNSIY